MQKKSWILRVFSRSQNQRPFVQDQNSDEQEVIPSDMLAVSYNNEWSSNPQGGEMKTTSDDQR